MAILPQQDPRYRVLDAWRGFACVIVVLHHAGFVLNHAGEAVGGWEGILRRGVLAFYHRLNLGVPLFFVISGYCIAASLDAHQNRRASPWRFLGRRVWRIYPPYWAAVLVFVVVVAGLNWLGWQPIRTGTHSLHLDRPDELSRSQWFGNLTLIETWRPKVFGGDPYQNLTRISWTLCFEEQFYFVSFVVLLLFRRQLFRALAVASALICAWALIAFDAGWFFKLDGIFPQLWYQFAVGLAVYWRLVVAGSPNARRAVDGGLLTLAGLGWYNKNLAMFIVAVFGLALIALRPFDAAWAGRRALAPFRACGIRCYSIYLIHLPVCTVGTEALVQQGWTNFWAMALVVAPVVALAGIGVGWLFASTVESWFHNPAPPWSPRIDAGLIATPEPPPPPPPLQAADPSSTHDLSQEVLHGVGLSRSPGFIDQE